MKKKKLVTGTALSFILLMGIVSMFSDMTHEGASSILGAYLTLGGASAAAIGFVSGFGEMIGYSLRIVSGRIADRTHKYWTLTIIGYIVDVMAIPALALVPKGGWILACSFMIIERAAKALKKPAKDTILSFAATQTGVGKSFAIQEFLDQLGAFIGPVILFLVLLMKKNSDLYSIYSFCFAILGIPACITIIILLFAHRRFPNPENFEPDSSTKTVSFHINKTYRFYIIATSLFALGFIDFNLITMHTVKLNLIASDTLPLIYAGAMAIDAFAALIFGWLYDKYGFKTLVISTALSSFFALFVFGIDTQWSLFLGVALWGIGMGAQESILKAAITTIVPKQHRSSGFGVFQTFFGIFWFIGSWVMGILYDHSMTCMILFSITAQIISIPFFLLAANALRKENKN